MTSTIHRLIHGDARDLSFLNDDSVHLVVTSPPYWNLKRYNENPDQLGHIQDYEAFLAELDKVWRHIFRILVPGGRLVCVVGDVCVARRALGGILSFPSMRTSVSCAGGSDLTISIRSSGTRFPTPPMKCPTDQSFSGSPMSPMPLSKTIWSSF